ncbi:MAG TPA: GatB/YqeY domain-containing protein [Candidatus Cloacimonetes bacterium]|nr:GatB/YqeY domain-containing protein [Candidatus Cloacimonadota bacterium]
MINRITNDIKKALLNKQKEELLVLRSLKSALKYIEIEQKKELTEEESIKVLKNQVKSREQAIELYIQGNRPELAEKEEFEIKIIKAYLPEPLTEAEMETEVTKTISELQAESMKDMGKVMKALSQKLGTRADGKILSNLVRQKLA